MGLFIVLDSESRLSDYPDCFGGFCAKDMECMKCIWRDACRKTNEGTLRKLGEHV